jgi:glutathionylspermidine synthase
VSSPVAAYLDLLTDQLAADTQARLDQHQAQHGLFFGDRAMCTVLRPRFLSPEQHRFLQRRVKVLLGAFAKIQDAALKSSEFRRQFGLSLHEDELAMLDPGFHPFPTSRFDSFYVSDDELRFTEYNSETPAGAAYNYALSLMFLALPAMQAFQRKFQVTPIATHYGVMNALLTAFQQWSGRRELPRIAILDWKEVPTYSEFVLYQNLFRHHGIDAVIADPREVAYTGDKLRTADGKPIDLIYKRVLISELLERGGIEHPVIRAVRARHVCMINPFRCKILYKKASFAVLSDERNAQLFTPEELVAITEHIPWTRVVAERQSQPPPLHKAGPAVVKDMAQRNRGQTVDLIKFLSTNKDALVLKPNDDYGGKGIVLGWTVDQTTWERSIQHALTTPYIVQERVNLPKEPFPYLVNGKLTVTDVMLDTNPFVTHGEAMEGALTRISSADLLNVTAGTGSTVPTFLVEPRIG